MAFGGRGLNPAILLSYVYHVQGCSEKKLMHDALGPRQKNNKNTEKVMIDTYHNQDKVFKEALDLFINQNLGFFGIKQTITEILSTETTETTTKKSFADNAFKTSTNEGVHFESVIGKRFFCSRFGCFCA